MLYYLTRYCFVESSLRNMSLRGVWEQRTVRGTRFSVFFPREKWRELFGSRTIFRAENPVPLTFFAPQPHGNAWYGDYVESHVYE